MPRSIRQNIHSLAFLVLLTVGGGAFAAGVDQIQNMVGPTLRCDGARTQPADSDDKANRCTLIVQLPVGATYVGTHYFTSADYPNDRGAPWETGAGEVSWAHFSQAVHAPDPSGREVVTVYYYNRSNRARLIAVSVDYIPVS